MDSDASVMEGNDIEDLGGGSFRTVGAVRRYSRLDQYAMGLLSPIGGSAVLLRGEPDEHVAAEGARTPRLRPASPSTAPAATC